jgi:antitoxin component of MazEF toxin-antitoxin module
MPAREKRKVLAAGDSVAITIPKPYADYHELRPGKTITLFYDDLLVAVPEGSESKLREKRRLLHELLR